jgi:hypothetical protein
MRKYSIYEQRIIREKLLVGSTLRQMFSQEFIQNARLEIIIDSENENHIFQYFSDSHNANRAVEELVNLVKLIESLERDGLVRKYFKPTPSLYEFDEVDSLEIGAAQSRTSQKFILPIDSEAEVVLFLYSNLDKTFKATQELRAIVGGNFESPEDKQHDEAIRQTRTANRIALLSLFAACIAICISTFQNPDEELREQIKRHEINLTKFEEKIKLDSSANSSMRKELGALRKSLDSLTSLQREKGGQDR